MQAVCAQTANATPLSRTNACASVALHIGQCAIQLARLRLHASSSGCRTVYTFPSSICIWPVLCVLPLMLMGRAGPLCVHSE